MGNGRFVDLLDCGFAATHGILFCFLWYPSIFGPLLSSAVGDRRSRTGGALRLEHSQRCVMFRLSSLWGFRGSVGLHDGLLGHCGPGQSWPERESQRPSSGCFVSFTQVRRLRPKERAETVRNALEKSLHSFVLSSKAC